MKFFYALAAFLMLTHAAFAQYYYEDVSNNPTNPRYYFEIPVGYSKASIEANGAEGGYFIDNFFEIFQPGGAGAYVAGDFILSAGDTIEVLIGGKGADGSIEQGGGGGGGGTFVFRVKNGVKTLLLAAGGGGGAGIDSVGKNGDFNDGIDVPGNLFFGSGGASFSSNATGYVTDAISLGEGATTFYDPNCSGGFGGGGAGAAEQGRESGGGGGGYGGGNGATANGAGGWGGTSFINPIATNTYRDVLTFFGGAAFSMYLYCDPIPRDSFKTICYGDSFFFKNEYLKTTGTYSDTIFGYEEGCDTVINLHLTVRDSLGSTTNVVICEGETFQYLDETLSQAGTYTYTRFSANGCDSVVTINLSVNPKKFGSFTQSICSGSTYFFNGNNLTQAGSYKDTLQAATTGCDSIVTLELIVNNASSSSASATICQGKAYVIGNQQFTQSGFYSVTLQASNGCDSVVSLFLNVIQPEPIIIKDSICNGSVYNFGQQQLSQSGTYFETFTAQNGCDSLVQLQLFVRPFDAETLNVSICSGSVYVLGGQSLTTSGTYYESFTNQFGCDSTVLLFLTVNPNTSSDVFDTICYGESYFFFNNVYSQSGTYIGFNENIYSCTDTVRLHLFVRDSLGSTTNVVICEGETFQYLDETLSQAGTYTYTRFSANGCDSVVTINLSVNPKKFGSFTQSICSGSTYFFNGNNLTQAGSYKDTLQAATTGCDSIVTLELIVLANSSYAFSDSICNGSSYVFGSQTLTQAGTYSRTIPAANGCDSVITLNLIVKPTASGTLNQTICAGSSFFFNNQNLTQAGTYTQTLSAANGCDSMVTLNLTVLPNAAFSFSDSICNGSSYAFGNQILTQAGTYSKTIPAANGCDSLITLNLKVLPVFSSTTNVAICNGESFTYLNEPLYDAGVYTFTLSALNGCDSIVTINLSVGTKPKLNIVSLQNPACNGSSNGSIDLAATNGTLPYEFSINNNAFSQQNSFTNLPAGSYTLIVKDANTCADTLQTSLTEPPAVLPPANIVSDTVCAGESATLQASGNGNLQWFDAANNLIGGGNSYSTEALLLNATFYVANSVGGCLSTPVPVNVVVVPLPVISPAVSSNSPLCEGATLQLNAPLIPNVSYEWFGPANFSSTQQSPAIANVSVKNNQGFYTLIVTDNASGCSSLPSSVLADITPQPQNILAAANGNICTGETLNLIASYFPNATYEWFGPSGFSSNVRNPSIQNATTNNAGIYSVIVSAANCAAVPATISVNVSAAPSVYAGNDTVISEGSFIQLNASGAYAYTWQPTNYLNNANSPNPVALLPVGEFELVVKGSSEAGCVSFDTVLVKVIENKNPTVYDLITPNGDGQNDRLSIPNIEKLSGYTLKIYARGGAVVLETKQYNNDWNATLNGKELPDGVYYYILELADGTILKGAITVIRN